MLGGGLDCSCCRRDQPLGIRASELQIPLAPWQTATLVYALTLLLLLPSPAYLLPSACAQISPRPGFVIKTKLVETGMKVFVNVCQHERIGESGLMKKLDKEGQEVRQAATLISAKERDPSPPRHVACFVVM